jgi:hypothetical protein
MKLASKAIALFLLLGASASSNFAQDQTGQRVEVIGRREARLPAECRGIGTTYTSSATPGIRSYACEMALSNASNIGSPEI